MILYAFFMAWMPLYAATKAVFENVYVMRDTCARNSVKWQLEKTDITKEPTYLPYSTCDDEAPDVNVVLNEAINRVHDDNQPALILQSRILFNTMTPNATLQETVDEENVPWDAIGICNCHPPPDVIVQDVGGQLLPSDQLCVNGFVLAPSGARKLLGMSEYDESPDPTSTEEPQPTGQPQQRMMTSTVDTFHMDVANDQFYGYVISPYLAKNRR